MVFENCIFNLQTCPYSHNVEANSQTVVGQRSYSGPVELAQMGSYESGPKLRRLCQFAPHCVTRFTVCSRSTASTSDESMMPSLPVRCTVCHIDYRLVPHHFAGFHRAREGRARQA
jgi:hypothetical protein